jgi:hypothetical protein
MHMRLRMDTTFRLTALALSVAVAASAHAQDAAPVEEPAPATEAVPEQPSPPPPEDVTAPAPPSTTTVSYDEPASPPEDDTAKKKPLKDLKLVLGFRLGYSLPFGKFTEQRELKENVSGALPIGIDAAVRLKGSELGLYAQIAVGFVGDTLEEGCSDCSAFGYRFGVQANYHLLPERVVDPWIGIAAGIERISFSESRTERAFTTAGNTVEVEIDRTTTFAALPELTLQAGIDIGGAPIAVGPFVSFSMAKYSDYEIKVDCDDFRCSDASLYQVDGSVPEQAWHHWLIVGVRGQYLLF